MLTAVNVAATFFAFRYIDRIGRRKLAIGGYVGMAVFALVAAAGLTWFNATPRIIVVMVGLAAFIASFAVGVGGTGWLLQGEVFPTDGARHGRVDRRHRRLGGQLRADRGLPRSGRRGSASAGVLVCFAALALMAIGFVPAVRAGDQWPIGRADHPHLRAGGAEGRRGQRRRRRRVAGAGGPAPGGRARRCLGRR